jgi:hypothetical protein
MWLCPKVALDHYAQVTEADIQEAAKMSLLADAGKAARNAAQHPAVSGGKGPQMEKAEKPEAAFLQSNTVPCGSIHEPALPGTGVEPART